MSSEDKTKLDGIASGANKYTHPSYTARNAGLYKITVDGSGHVSGATAVAKSDITNLGIPAQDTTYDAATTSEDGLMSSEDKTKLNGIASGANKYTHPSYTQRSSGLYKITVDTSGHVSGATAVTKSDITALGIPAQDTNTTYTVATTSKDGLMSSEDKTKLNGIATGANKTVVDSSLSSSSTNPVQNKVINSALAGKVSTSRTVNGKALSSNIVLTASDVNAIPSSQKGTAGGVASLDSSGFILSSQLPPSVDEILEGYLYNNAFYEDEEHDVEIEAQSSKIYVDLNNNLTYRWSGTAYVEISKSLAIGETSSTAYRGDRGKIAYDHSQAAHARTDATKVSDSSTNGNILVNGSQVNVYTHPSYTQRSSGLYKITVDGSGHVSGATAVTKSDITALGIPAQDTNTTYSVATTSKDGLMSSEDKTKLDGIASGANKYSHPSYTAKSSGLYKVTVDSTGHVSATSAVTKADITALGIPGQDTNTTYTLGSFGITATATEINKLDGLTATTAELNYVDGVTSNIQTQLNGKLSTSGTAAAATKLATGRSIGLSTAVSATTQTFDGTGNITIPVNGVKEAYLEWGGRSMSGGFGPLDASLIPELGANRLAFMPASAIEIQYSTNGGSTWATYPSVTDTAKINLFNGNNSNFYIGANSSSGVTKDNYQLRIIFTSNIAKVYTALQKFAIYLSTQGSNGSWCTIDAITKANVDAGKDTWTTFANKVPVAGWSGWNIINVSSLTTYSNNSSQYQKVRFTFGVTSHSSSSKYPGLVVNKILGFGGMGWQIPSTMAGTGRMYTYDASQNVTFPANVKATKFQGATASTSEAGLMSAADKTKLDGIATGANKYTHPSYTAKSSGLYKITVDSSGHVSATTAVSKSDITALGIPGQDTNTTYSAATTSTAGLMSAADKTKLNGIATGANKYSHPSYTQRSSGLYKITVDTSGHVSGATAVTKSDITGLGIPSQDTNTWIALKGATSSADGTAGYAPAPTAGASNRYLRSDGTWAVPPDTNTTYSVATTSTNGLMSAADKVKLNGIATNANNYTHPTFTARSAGLYKITVNNNGHVSAATAVAKSDITALGIPAQDTTYSAATTSKAGLMSASDKTKLNGIHAGANNIEYSTTQPTGQAVGDYWVKLE